METRDSLSFRVSTGSWRLWYLLLHKLYRIGTVVGLVLVALLMSLGIFIALAGAIDGELTNSSLRCLHAHISAFCFLQCGLISVRCCLPND